MSRLTSYQAAVCLMSTGSKDNYRIERLLRSAARDGNAAAAYQMGMYYLAVGKRSLARQAFTEAQRGGNLLAQSQLDALSQRQKPEGQRETNARMRHAIVTGNIQELDSLLKIVKPTAWQQAPEPPLVLAIQSGHQDAAIWIIDHHLYDQRSTVTYLSQAIRGHLDRVALRLIASAGRTAITRPLPDGDSLLFMALRHDSPGVIRDLISAGASPWSKDTDGRTAMQYAFDKHDRDVSRQFAESGHPLDKLQQAALLRLTRKAGSPYYRRPMILVAAESFDDSLVERLVATGSDPWHAPVHGASAMEILYLRGNRQLVRKLIKQSAPPVRARMLISLAIMKDDAETLKLLTRLARYRDRDYPRIDTSPLWQAASSGTAVVKQLIAWQGMDTRTDGTGKNLLIHALEQHNLKMATDLVDAGFPVKARDHMGRTAHWYAANEGASEVLEALVRRADLINVGDINGQTPLLRAVENGNLATVRVALAANVEVDSQSDAGNTALMLAAAGKPEVIKLLLRRHADYKLRNHNSLTALMIAATEGCNTCTKLLVSAGANPNRKDSRGRSARDMMEGR